MQKRDGSSSPSCRKASFVNSILLTCISNIFCPLSKCTVSSKSSASEIWEVNKNVHINQFTFQLYTTVIFKAALWYRHWKNQTSSSSVGWILYCLVPYATSRSWLSSFFKTNDIFYISVNSVILCAITHSKSKKENTNPDSACSYIQ